MFGILSFACQIPHKNSSVEVLTDEEWSVAKQAISQAVAQLQDFRKQEGAALMIKFNEKVDNIEKLLGEIEPYESARVEKNSSTARRQISRIIWH